MTTIEDDELFNTDEKVLKLTPDEALFIDDSLTMMIDAADGAMMFSAMRPLVASAQIPAPLDLIEKIAVAVLFTMDNNNEGILAEVHLNDGYLLYIREICQSHVKIGGEPVGYNLKRKIYMALYGSEYKLGRQLDDLLTTFTPDNEVIQHPSSSFPDDESCTSLS